MNTFTLGSSLCTEVKEWKWGSRSEGVKLSQEKTEGGGLKVVFQCLSLFLTIQNYF